MPPRPVEAGGGSPSRNAGLSSTVIEDGKGNDRRKKDTLAEGWIAGHPRTRRVSDSNSRRGEERDLFGIGRKELSSAGSGAVEAILYGDHVIEPFVGFRT